jgi:predicted nucleotidyltransferase
MDTLHVPGRDALADLCSRWQVVELAVFGSTARGEARDASDVDLLVKFRPGAPWSSLDLIDMREELAVLFGRPVDLVEEGAIRNPYRRASILRDKAILYAA